MYRILLSLGLLCCAGCDGTGDLEGTVTFQNKKLKLGSVIIKCSDDQLRSCEIKDGRYAFAKLPRGHAVVTVNSPDPRTQKMATRGQPKATKPTYAIKDWQPLPEKYSRFEQSPLKVEVRSGSTTYDLTLTK